MTQIPQCISMNDLLSFFEADIENIDFIAQYIQKNFNDKITNNNLQLVLADNTVTYVQQFFDTESMLIKIGTNLGSKYSIKGNLLVEKHFFLTSNNVFIGFSFVNKIIRYNCLMNFLRKVIINKSYLEIEIKDDSVNNNDINIIPSRLYSYDNKHCIEGLEDKIYYIKDNEQIIDFVPRQADNLFYLGEKSLYVVNKSYFV